jgi:hypothetical protein
MRLILEKKGLYDKYYEFIFEWIIFENEYKETDVNDILRVKILITHAIHLAELKNEIKDETAKTL